MFQVSKYYMFLIANKNKSNKVSTYQKKVDNCHWIVQRD